ncbi:RimK-like ATP-grasp domain-containing protein [Aquimarina sp. MAR_2010_214]|uniref:hypothetical protein n=1 Tax=Aquimarina sp. MAR_2010_214 TaxID=1250026 RepID=UPI000C7158EB|nr:hypothetical protein [Aquimarina sp. MAR_2010_214]PKV48684.1 RimK-like ATP-grasp domain-containing protein [Aquimarina sp. MAR_2010_214]
MILIYSKDIDDFVNQVIDCLDEDFIRIADQDKICIDEVNITNEENTFYIHSPYFEEFDIDALTSIWFNGGSAKTYGNDYENSCYSLLINSFLNHKQTNKIGRLISNFELNKFDVLKEAQVQGFKVPDTLFTGSKKKLNTFYKKYSGQNGIVCKRMTDQYFYDSGEYIFDFSLTFSINSNILTDIPEHFAISLFQEKIVADYEIRVIFIKDTFYAMSIHAFDNEIDYRSKLMSLNNIRTIPYNLPSNTKKKLEKMLKRFDLNFASIDLMFSNNEYYFLEINPVGQISFVNNTCNFYIENQLSEILKNEK